MFKIENKTIHVTRGDIATIGIKAKNVDGTDYTFKKDDVVRLNVFKRKDCSCVVLHKDVKASEETLELEISLTSENTKIEELINKPLKYWYEVVLNPDTNPQTIIGYDISGAKEFILYPEAKEVEL